MLFTKFQGEKKKYLNHEYQENNKNNKNKKIDNVAACQQDGYEKNTERKILNSPEKE